MGGGHGFRLGPAGGAHGKLGHAFEVGLRDQRGEHLELGNADDVRALGHALVAFSPDMNEDLARLRAFLMERMYRHCKFNRTRSQARRILSEMFQLFMSEPGVMPPEWSAKAELAIQKGREDLARAALTEKLAEVKKCDQLEQDKARVAEVLAQLTADSERLATKLTEAREKQKMLTLREQTAHSRIRARAQVDNQRMHELMARFDGFQGRVDQLEAQLEAATLGQNPSLEAQFRELELNDEIERELARLKGQKVEA